MSIYFIRVCVYVCYSFKHSFEARGLLTERYHKIRHMDGKRSVNNRELHAYYMTINWRASPMEIGACRCGRAAFKTSAGIKMNYHCVHSAARAT